MDDDTQTRETLRNGASKSERIEVVGTSLLVWRRSFISEGRRASASVRAGEEGGMLSVKSCEKIKLAAQLTPVTSSIARGSATARRIARLDVFPFADVTADVKQTVIYRRGNSKVISGASSPRHSSALDAPLDFYPLCRARVAFFVRRGSAMFQNYSSGTYA